MCLKACLKTGHTAALISCCHRGPFLNACYNWKQNQLSHIRSFKTWLLKGAQRAEITLKVCENCSKGSRNWCRYIYGTHAISAPITCFLFIMRKVMSLWLLRSIFGCKVELFLMYDSTLSYLQKKNCCLLGVAFY